MKKLWNKIKNEVSVVLIIVGSYIFGIFTVIQTKFSLPWELWVVPVALLIVGVYLHFKNKD